MKHRSSRIVELLLVVEFFGVVEQEQSTDGFTDGLKKDERRRHRSWDATGTVDGRKS